MQVYTAGYATSLISLISAIFVFTAFRYNENPHKAHATKHILRGLWQDVE